MPTSLDTILLNTYITQHRALIGKMEKTNLESYDNKFIDGIMDSSSTNDNSGRRTRKH